MKKIFIVVLLLQLKMLGGMEKSNLIKAYKSWAVARVVAHFTKPELYNHNGTPLKQCQFIPLKDLHAELDRKMKNHLLMRYVAVPVIGISSLAVFSVLTYKNLKYYS